MTYKDISIKKYLELIQLVEDSDVKDLLSIQVSEIAILFGLDENTVLNMKLDDYQDKVRQISFLSQAPKPNPRRLNSIVIAGKKFDVVKDVKNMTAGQFIDYNTFVGFKDDKYIPHLISVFVIPQGKKYGEYDQDEHIEFLANNLDIQTAMDICFFFLQKFQTLLKAMELCLDWQMKKVMKDKTLTPEKKKEIQEKLDSLKNGVGLITSTPSQT